MLYRAIPSLVAIAFALAGFAFDRKTEFPDWDERTVIRMVTDSAWAKVKTVKIEWLKKEDRLPISYKDVPGADKGKPIPDSYGSPVGGVGSKPRAAQLPDRAEVIVRWASALPVRQAKALFRQREQKASAEKRNEWIGVPGADYVVEVYGVPALVAHQGTGTVESLVRQGAWLQTRSGRKIAASRVESEVNGLELTVLVHFAKTNPLQVSDGDVEFFADFQLFQVREKFKLSSMVYLNHLEL
ncbi:MAG: hypothetical protein HY820_33940 [Acidobacteria bacterium]|nr:hypothetical protein [Acidobacteriota bacterium]